MARKNQRLINFHTSGLTSMPQASDVYYGEIVVRHNEQQPELLIKVNESEFGVIPGSGAVASAISVAVKNVTDYIDGEVSTLEGSITDLQEAVSGISTDIGENYVSNEAFKQAQGELFNSATTVASEDATAKVNAAKDELNNSITAATNTLQNSIDAVDEKADANAQALADYKVEVSDTYETKDNVVTAIEDAKDSVYASATTAAAADATTKANAAKNEAINAAAVSANTLLGMIDGVDDKVDADVKALADYKTEVTNTYETKANVATAIEDAKDSVYASATTTAAADAQTKANAAKTDAINAAAASAKTLSDAIAAVDDNLDALSAVTETVKATADSAVQSATVNSGAKVTKNGTALDFDFSELIIDCGDF